MPLINIPGSGHGRFTSAAGNRYWEYDSFSTLFTLAKAYYMINQRSYGNPACNACFTTLPNGKDFDDTWDAMDVWVNFESRSDRGWYGITYGVGGKDISISQSAFNKGTEWVAGTLVHELAHVNGAPTTTAQADVTLLCCGFAAAYEGVIGQRKTASPNRYA